MKKIILSLLGIAFYFSSLFAQSFLDSVQIKGTVKGFDAGVIRLLGSFAEQNYFADSAIVQAGGTFEFRQLHPYKSGLFFVILPDYSNFQLLLDTDQKFELTTTKGDLIKTMQIKDCQENELLYQNLMFQAAQEPRYEAIRKKMEGKTPADADYKTAQLELKQVSADYKNQVLMYQQKYPNAFFTKFKAAGQNPDLEEPKKPNGDLDTLRQLIAYRQKFWDNVDFSDVRLLHTPVIFNKLKRFMTELTPPNPDSLIQSADFVIQKSLVNKEMFKFISNWIAVYYQPTKTTIMDGEAVQVHVVNKYFTKELAFWTSGDEIEKIRKRAWEMEGSLMNKKGQDVVALDNNGLTKSIYALQSPFVVVYMFNTHCEHCMKETPKLKKFAEEWKSKGVEVFSIVLESSEEEWKEYIAKNQLQTWTNVRDPSNRSIYGKYYVDITPEMYVLNKDRIIIGKNLHTDQLETIIESENKKKK